MTSCPVTARAAWRATNTRIPNLKTSGAIQFTSTSSMLCPSLENSLLREKKDLKYRRSLKLKNHFLNHSFKYFNVKTQNNDLIESFLKIIIYTFK